jgi:hypothetical protein
MEKGPAGCRAFNRIYIVGGYDYGNDHNEHPR